MRRANKASKFASPAAHQQELEICFDSHAAPTKPPNLVRLRRANKGSRNLLRLRRATNKASKVGSPCAPIKPQNLFRLWRANKVLKFGSPAARQQRLQICFACGAPKQGIQSKFRSPAARQQGRARNLLRLRHASNASKFISPAAQNVSILPAARQQGLKFYFACGAPTRSPNLVTPVARQQGLEIWFASRLRRTNKASRFCSPAARQNKASKFISPAARLQATRSRNWLRLWCANKASKFASPAARQQLGRARNLLRLRRANN